MSAPGVVHERLRRSADGPVPVVHRGRDAVYVAVDGWCVGVVDARAAQVPCALRTAGDALPAAGTARVEGGVLHLDDQPLVVGRLVDVRVPALHRVLLHRLGRRRRAAGPGTARPGPAAAGPGLHLGVAQVAALVGAGEGLTPYGDDLLCGWLATHRAAGVATPAIDAAVRGLLYRTTLLSATLLDCALRGEALPEFTAWLTALGSPDEGAEDAAAARLDAVGHTSGLALRRGAQLALGELEHAGAAA